MKKLSINQLTLLLAPLVIGHSFAMDIYVPAIPIMTSLFHTTDKMMMLTLSSFMFTAGIMQLVIGPLSDSYGRKKTVGWMIAIFALGCILCALAADPLQLTVFRIIQSIGSCGMMVIGFAIVRDCFFGRDSAKVYASLNGIIAFSPMFAPFIGSFLDTHFSWQATFLSLLIIVFIAYFNLFFYLPETLAKENRQPFSTSIFGEYWHFLNNRTFTIYTLLTGFGLSYLYLFCALSPFLIIGVLNIPEAHYGFYFFFMGVSFFIGSVICRLIVGKIGIFWTCFVGHCISLIGGTVMLSLYYLSGLTIDNFVYPMLLVGIGGTFCLGAGNGGAMAPFASHIGAASALSGAFRFLFSALIGAMVIRDVITTTLPLSCTAIATSLIGLTLLTLNIKHLKPISLEKSH